MGRSEEENFEAMEHSDRVFDEELEGGGWKRNMDKREVVPTMKVRRPGFDLAGKGQGTVAGELDTWGTLHVERQQSGGAALFRKRAIRTAIGSQKSFTLTIRWNLANLVKTYHGIVVHQHLTDSRRMA